MRKFILIYFLFSLVPLNNYAQQLYPIKESFDQKLEPIYSSTNYNNNSTNWWEGWGWTLLSYLRMYETTHDKAYLNKFIKHSFYIQFNRSINDLWSVIPDDGQLVLYTGKLLRPMAQFVHLVKNDITLYNTYLLPGILPVNVLNNPTQIILGYGDYANWLEARVKQSMNKMINLYWVDDINCFKRKISPDEYPIEINFNASYASTMFYIGNVDPINYSNYTQKAQNIVNFFSSRISEYPPNQSYTWFHNEFHADIPDQYYREDVSHGATDIQIPLIAYELYGSWLYQLSEMNKFANTFSFNIWDRYNQVFHNNVFGLDSELPDGNILNSCGYTANGTPNFYTLGELLAWMPLYNFDNINEEPNDIYTVLITQAVKLLTDDPTAFLPSGYCYATTSSLSGSQSFYGLSEVIKAQWDKECINLTLYNRDMAYDQDFFVKNNLVVAPALEDDFHELGDNSFADPIIQDNTFIIPANINVNMVAGESISLLPGFSAKAGCSFSASISPNSCTDGRMASTSDRTEINEFTDFKEAYPITKSHENIIQKIKVYPNPNNGIFNISIPTNFSTENLKITIYDNLGQLKFTENRLTNTIDLSTFSNGIYFLEINTNQGIFREKIIKQ